MLVTLVLLCLGVSVMQIGRSTAHRGFERETLRGTWVFAESYWGAGQEAAYVGTISFDGSGGCAMTWVGIKAQGGSSRGEDACNYEVASDGSGTVTPNGADNLTFQISRHGNQIDYVVDSQNPGQVGRGTMTRR